MTHTLVLCRHGQSEWNARNLFTGWKDPDLTPLGVEEAERAGARVMAAGLKVEAAFTSGLRRAQHTLERILAAIGRPDLPVTRDERLNERDYGDLAGLDKDDARARWGEEQVHIWRRSYDVAPPGGESLRDTAARVLPYYIHDVLPVVLSGRTTLVVAHGNSIRALVMALEGLSPKAIVDREIATGVPLVYRLRPDSSVHAVEELA